ncbi:hypothetical protein GUJ93_ZPchr0001g31955 [Zizania palustris]|uniref:Uncharacterized protein n=1 Tax=Zizania palustris TaxID=103762 RepID=A0A8J5V2S4_ZIZPA|nr:hypothetical protein GUJ93_ZPchr0001g31955 [Zizania palustris]
MAAQILASPPPPNPPRALFSRESILRARSSPANQSSARASFPRRFLPHAAKPRSYGGTIGRGQQRYQEGRRRRRRMQAPRPSGPVRQAQRKRGDVLPQRHLMAMLGGQLPRVPDGQHHQVPGGVDLDLAGGGEMQGQGHPHPPMAALAGDDLDFISRMSYSSGHNPYSALEHTSNENSFVNAICNSIWRRQWQEETTRRRRSMGTTRCRIGRKKTIKRMKKRQEETAGRRRRDG